MMRRVAMWLRALFHRTRVESEMDREMRLHVEMETEHNISLGMSHTEARRRALVAFGGVEASKERVRDERRTRWLEHLVADVRHAARTLAAKPTYAIAVVITLALGIGANSAMFSLVNAVLLRPLPYTDADRIVSLSIRHRGQDLGVVDDRDYFAWLDGSRTLMMAAYRPTDGVVASQAGPQRLRGMRITADYLAIFGVTPLIGRAFIEDDYRPSAPPVILLGERAWRRDFGSDASVIGRVIRIDDEPMTVVGVIPASFTTSRPVMYWRPEILERPTKPDESDFYFVVGRLRDAASMDMARADLAALSARLHAAGPEAERSVAPIVMTLHERRFGDQRKPLVLLFASVAVLLLIACANLVNLALARATERRREIAVRLALGASRWRIMQGVLCETILLSLGGAALGLVVAVASIKYIVRLSPASIGFIESVPLDGPVFGFTLTVAVVTGIAIGLAPAIVAVRNDGQQVLSSGGPRGTGSKAQRAIRRAMVVAQLATALVMLTGAGLTARTFWNVLSIDPGFNPERLIDVEIDLPEPRYSARTADTFLASLLARVRSLPAIESADFTDTPPLMGGMTFAPIDSSAQPTPQTTIVSVGPQYLRTIGATIRAGRAIDSTDRAGAPKAVVVNSALAKRMFGGNALGRSIQIARDTGRIVGVIADLPQHEFEGTLSGAIYWARAQQERSTHVHLVARYSGSVAPIETAITGIMQSMDRTLAPPTYRQMNDVLAERVAPRKFTFVLLGMFATLAALLAVIGLYGLLAHLVATRTREIGIRIALGADPTAVTRLVLAQGMTFAAAGVGIGVVVSFVAVRAIQALVYNVSVHDPRTFLASAVLLTIVSALASYIPARRASRVSPVVALQAT